MAEEELSIRIGADDDDNVRAFEERMRARSADDQLRGIVSFLRGIPASDGDKKRELAKFFQSDFGQNFTREERFEAYNDLLGEDRNQRRRG